MAAARAAGGAARRRTTTSKRTVLLKQDVRGAKAIESHRTQERARLRNYETIERVAEQQQVLQAKTREYRSRRSEGERHTSAQAGRQAAYSGAGAILSAPKSDSNPVMLILFTMFGLIVFYTLVTKPQPTSRFFGSLSDWLALVSTSTPIFQRKTST